MYKIVHIHNTSGLAHSTATKQFYLYNVYACFKKHSQRSLVSKQGFGVQVLPSQISKPVFLAAILEVLRTPSYSAVAQAMSIKLRARKRTPVQEGAGDELAQGFNELLTLMLILELCARLSIINPI